MKIENNYSLIFLLSLMVIFLSCNDEQPVEEILRSVRYQAIYSSGGERTRTFSGVAKAATLIKDGKLDRPVTGTLIAGNVFEVLKNLSGVSSETERTFAATLPYLRLEGISVTAE